MLFKKQGNCLFFYEMQLSIIESLQENVNTNILKDNNIVDLFI